MSTCQIIMSTCLAQRRKTMSAQRDAFFIFPSLFRLRDLASGGDMKTCSEGSTANRSAIHVGLGVTSPRR